MIWRGTTRLGRHPLLVSMERESQLLFARRSHANMDRLLRVTPRVAGATAIEANQNRMLPALSASDYFLLCFCVRGYDRSAPGCTPTIFLKPGSEKRFMNHKAADSIDALPKQPAPWSGRLHAV